MSLICLSINIWTYNSTVSSISENIDSCYREALFNKSRTSEDSSDDSTDSDTSDETTTSTLAVVDDNSGDKQPDPGAGGIGGDRNNISKQYFYYEVDDENNVTYSYISNKFDDGRMSNFLQIAISNNDDFNSIDKIYYKRYITDETKSYLLIDARAEFESYTSTLQISLIICGISAVLITIASFFISGLIIRPYEKSYEKEKRFLTNATHELKTPLTIISSNNEILEKDYGKLDALVSSDKQIKRMVKLINEMVLLHKIDESKKGNESEFNIDELLYEAVEPYINIFKENNIDLTLNIDENVTVKKNMDMIFQLFSIMLDNMRKYTTKDGKAIISLKSNKNKSVEILFANTSSDLDKNKISHVFERFYKMDESHSKKIEGFGIGLSIASEIVKLNDGNIKAFVDNDMFNILINFKK